MSGIPGKHGLMCERNGEIIFIIYEQGQVELGVDVESAVKELFSWTNIGTYDTAVFYKNGGAVVEICKDGKVNLKFRDKLDPGSISFWAEVETQAIERYWKMKNGG